MSPFICVLLVTLATVHNGQAAFMNSPSQKANGAQFTPKFKDIDISAVLAEAEAALHSTRSSLSSEGSDASINEQLFHLKESLEAMKHKAETKAGEFQELVSLPGTLDSQVSTLLQGKKGDHKEQTQAHSSLVKPPVAMNEAFKFLESSVDKSKLSPETMEILQKHAGVWANELVHSSSSMYNAVKRTLESEEVKLASVMAADTVIKVLESDEVKEAKAALAKAAQDSLAYTTKEVTSGVKAAYDSAVDFVGSEKDKSKLPQKAMKAIQEQSTQVPGNLRLAFARFSRMFSVKNIFAKMTFSFFGFTRWVSDMFDVTRNFLQSEAFKDAPGRLFRSITAFIESEETRSNAKKAANSFEGFLDKAFAKGK